MGKIMRMSRMLRVVIKQVKGNLYAERENLYYGGKGNRE